jgi:hypothetical protein
MKFSSNLFKLKDIILPAIKIAPNGNITESTINLARFSGIIFVQPGITPPSYVPKLSQEFLNTKGAKGCTGEATEVAKFCQRKTTDGYILSSKPLEDLKKACIEKKEEADKANTSHPFGRLTLISDINFMLAAQLREEYKQIIKENGVDKYYYQRFSLELKNGIVEKISKHDFDKDPSKAPADIAKERLNEVEQQNIVSK